MICDKISYTTFKEAREAIHGLVVKRKGSFKIYKCFSCKLFHITTTTRKKIRPVKKQKYKPALEDAKKSKFKFQKPSVNKCIPGERGIETTQKLISPLQAQILKSKIAANNRNEL